MHSIVFLLAANGVLGCLPGVVAQQVDRQSVTTAIGLDDKLYERTSDGMLWETVGSERRAIAKGVQAMAAANGRLYWLHDGRAIVEFDGQKERQVTTKNDIQAMAAANGRLYWLHDGRAIVEFDGQKERQVTTKNDIQAMAAANGRLYWLHDGRAIVEFDGQKERQVTTKNDIQAMAAANGRLYWLHDGRAIVEFDGQKERQVTTKNDIQAMAAANGRLYWLHDGRAIVEFDGRKERQVDTSVAAIAPAHNAGSLLVLGTDGKLFDESAGWQEHGRSQVASNVVALMQGTDDNSGTLNTYIHQADGSVSIVQDGRLVMVNSAGDTMLVQGIALGERQQVYLLKREGSLYHLAGTRLEEVNGAHTADLKGIRVKECSLGGAALRWVGRLVAEKVGEKALNEVVDHAPQMWEAAKNAGKKAFEGSPGGGSGILGKPGDFGKPDPNHKFA